MSLSQSASRQPQPVAIVGVGAIMPEAPSAAAFWTNIAGGRYSITDVPKDRWDPDLYYDPDPRAPDKTYSSIGGWVREFAWDPIAWRLPVPPKVAEQMDDGQKWAVSAARAALIDAGWPGWGVDPERVAVIVGNAMGGEKHYATNLRIQLPEFMRELGRSPAFAALPADVRQMIAEQTAGSFVSQFPEINEDTMPGELANVTAGRIANLFNFRGPGYTTDAACASALAALSAAAEGLIDGQFDAVVTGGVDRNMNVAAFVKFCKIGALSATGTRPFDAGADGFVMAEGAALFVLKRLADAERDGDRIYAVLLGVGGSSDGKGKGITAPNPIGQRLAIGRAWRNACADPSTVSLVEAHGTSTRVGDAAELESLTAVFGAAGAAPGSIALGSVKSNLGHLKAAAGAAGLLKLVMSLHEKALPPSLNFRDPNPNIDWAAAPFRVNTELREWPVPPSGVRRGGVSAFGFGGTNFHAVLEEYVPGRFAAGGTSLPGTGLRATAGADIPVAADAGRPAIAAVKAPLRGALVVGGATEADLAAQLAQAGDQAAGGTAPQPQPPDPALARASVRAAIDYGSAAELAAKAALAIKALTSGTGEMRKMLRSRGIFLGRGPAPKVAFLYTGQGSQYVNMLAGLRATEPIVAQTFAEADQVMTPLLGKPLTDYIFIDGSQPSAVAQLEQQLLQTEITQPAVLAADIALTRLLAAYGIGPDMVMGHSLGEYAALVAAGALSFGAALEAVSARGREMASLEIPDKGAMAAVMAPLAEIERVVASIDGYVVTANVNSTHQAVIGGATAAVEQAIAKFQQDGRTAVRLPVSHAFHTSIVAPASEPLRRTLARLQLHGPALPIVANVSGEFYPDGPDVAARMLDILGRQVASPVQFVKGLSTLYAAGARVFVEVGPKRALQGFAEDVLGQAHDDVVTLFTNHPKNGDVPAFNAALCGMYAAGVGYPPDDRPAPATATPAAPAAAAGPAPARPGRPVPHLSPTAPGPAMSDDRYSELGHLLADLLDRGRHILDDADGPAAAHTAAPESGDAPAAMEPVVITGAALGLPGVDRIFDDENIARILSGQQFIDVIPRQIRREMVDKHITRLVKSDRSDPVFETIDGEADVIKLAGRYAALDAVHEFGLDPDRDAALDPCSRLAIGAGIDALRDAGIPLVRQYHATTLGTQLPGAWRLPDDLRDDTGVVFASAFPGYESFAREINSYQEDRARRTELATLQDVRGRMNASDPAVAEVGRRIVALQHALETRPFTFDRRFLFRVLAMGHSQFAELIGARGPNTQVNSACASTAIAVSVAEDWIRAGRCRRVIVVAADDAGSDALLPWLGSGFLASGAAATDDLVEDAALPFDRRRHGMIIGSGAAALVIESAAAARERGISPICEILAVVTANSAFHGTRLDIEHIGQVMEKLIRQAERRGIDRRAIAGETVFVSHETYTPARGGSASAEVSALRQVFGQAADSVVITNTKGFTGHAMGAGIEEVVAVKTLETGVVPPVANFREIDPELGPLNLSRGGAYPVSYALRLAAGFGSQVAMMLLRWTAPPDGQRRAPTDLGFGYRIADDATWHSWLDRAGGHRDARIEVVQHRLRVVDDGPSQGAVAPADRPAAMPATVPALVPAPAPVAPARAAPVPAVPAPVAPAAAVPAPAAPAPPVPAAAQVAAPALEPSVFAADPAAQAVLDIVEGLTGYSRDLLEPDLDLEADLGVDTVKQAEVFAAVRERFGIPRDENLRLRDFPTLAHVIGFARDRAQEADLAPAPAAAAPAEPQGAEPAGAVPAGAAVTGQIVQIVSEMTGYPAELLDLDLDLEADLGVDTVKQAEVFAAVREQFGIPRDENLRLRDFPTIAHVIGFARDRAQAAKTPGPEQLRGEETEVAAPASARTAPALTGDISAAERLPRRIPVPVLRPPMRWCSPTAVTLDETKRLIVMADAGGVADALSRRLGALGVTALVLEAGSTATEIDARLTTWLAAGPVHGLYWLAALDAEPPIGELDLASWRDALSTRVKNLHAVVRRLDAGGHLGPRGTFLVAATRLGGYHGYDDAGAVAPLGGAVTGFVKAYRRERADVLAKAVDFPVSRKTASLADALIEETQRDPGAIEIGRADGRRWAVGLREVPFGDGAGGLTLDSQAVFVVTGAAGSIVSAIVADLAKASGGTFHLLDMTPEPDPADEDLARFAADRGGLKAAISDRLKAGGRRPTPVLIERELSRYERLQSALTAIQAVRAAGGEAHYHAVDLTDADAVGRIVADIRDRHGRIDVLLHAAGLDISHGIADKDRREFDLVFDVKSDGWFNLLHAAADLPIGATVAFSSVAARFGNAGQTDYSAANDLLCKITSSFRRTRPATRAIALDWTAWGGLGMATRGSVPKVMEMAGIEMLPPEAGIAWIGRELTAGPFRGEVVVGGKLGVLTGELDPAGGLDVAAVSTSGAGPMAGSATGMGVYSGLTVETTLDPAVQPFLHDHRIDSIPVLPGVMGAEAFAAIALLAAGDLHVGAIERMEFLTPVKFYRDEPRTLTVRAVVRKDGADLVADCVLAGSRVLKGDAAPQWATHFTGSVRLTAQPPRPETDDSPVKEAAVSAGHADIYRVYFHGPAYQVLDAAWRYDGGAVGRLAGHLPAGHKPAEDPTATEPRLVELCFQTAGLWEIGQTGRLALPAHADLIRTLRRPAAGGPLFAVVHPASDGSFDCRVVDSAGGVLVRIDGYRTVPLPDAISGGLQAPIRAALRGDAVSPRPGEPA
jgi:acyl transferase domain-containing protein/acyl carrier protein